MRDAVVAGSSVAQLVNCLQSLFLAHEDKFWVTRTYHVFDMYVAHQGGQSIRTMVSAPHISYSWNAAPATLRGLSSSASLKGRELIITVTNPSIDAAREAEIVIRGGTAVQPKSVTGGLKGFSFPAASVTKFSVTLA